MDQVVNFTFAPGVAPEEQEKTLQLIRALPQVSFANLLSPFSKDSDIRLMAFARLENDADVGSIVRTLEKVPAVERVSLPAQRTLASGVRG